ncbi:MAG: hypothetical protein F6K32_24305 [Desertifilum sp. SIO1I2]|nr:hypothetical protein [Desertifilum sp. SIO1I2]
MTLALSLTGRNSSLPGSIAPTTQTRRQPKHRTPATDITRNSTEVQLAGTYLWANLVWGVFLLHEEVERW